MIMKNIAKILFLAAVLAGGLASCKDDSADNPDFGPNEVYIYDNKASSQAVTKDVVQNLPMTVSPADGSVECRWLLDGVLISNEKDLTYVFTVKGTFTLRFEAARGNRTIGKNYEMTVTD